MPMICRVKNSSGSRRVSTHTEEVDSMLKTRVCSGIQGSRRMARTLCCAGLTLGVFVACSSGTPPERSSILPTPSKTEELRSEQIRTLWEYDRALNATPDHCDTLCDHQNRICSLATQICRVIATQPNDPRAKETCDTATTTCRDSTNRIPNICLCSTVRKNETMRGQPGVLSRLQ